MELMENPHNCVDSMFTTAFIQRITRKDPIFAYAIRAILSCDLIWRKALLNVVRIGWCAYLIVSWVYYIDYRKCREFLLI